MAESACEAERDWVLEFARTPRAGQVKTRLARSQGAAEAARIYRWLATQVHDVLLRMQAKGELRCVLSLALAPGEARPATPFLGGAREVWIQSEGDLGQRMQAAFERAFSGGAVRVLIVGTDIVGLSEAHLRQALSTLREVDAVLSPTPDGGFGLLGLSRPPKQLLLDLPWSQPDTLSATLRRLEQRGWRTRCLGGLRDVDRAADLEGVIPWVSVLIPVWNEAPRLARLLPLLMQQADALRPHVEVIVADGGSADESAHIASQHGAHVVRCSRGRGTQLRAAAAQAQGRWLWTLHADAQVAPGALDAALAFARRGHPRWGWCEVRCDHPSRWLKAFLTLTEGRARIFRLPYGDQGMLVRRASYEAVGGYAPIPLMEDVALARALASHGTPGRVATRLTISGRRWARHGVFATTGRNLLTLARYLLGRASPDQLARGYSRGEATP